MKILVVQVKWLTSTVDPWKPDWLNPKLVNTKSFFLENSYGKLPIEWTVSPFVAVDQSRGGDMGYLHQACVPLLAPFGLNQDLFDRVIFINPGVSGFGKGYAGGKYCWILGGIDYANFSIPHEIGHTFFGDNSAHAGAFQIGTTEMIGTQKNAHMVPLTVHTFQSPSRMDGTGDPTDTMGYSGTLAHFSMVEKARVGWIVPTTFAGGDATYALTAAASQAGGTYAVRLVGAMFDATSKREYWIEYRTKTGWDSKIPLGDAGVQIRVRGDFGLTAAALLDMQMNPNPGSSYNNMNDMALQPGDTWEDGTFRLTFDSVDADGRAVVSVHSSAVALPPPAPPPVVYPPAGTIVSTVCHGVDLWGIYADGSGGTTERLVQANSLGCGYVAPKPVNPNIATLAALQPQVAALAPGAVTQAKLDSIKPLVNALVADA